MSKRDKTRKGARAETLMGMDNRATPSKWKGVLHMNKVPLRLQFFAEPPAAGGQTPPAQTPPATPAPQNQQPQNTTQAIDYGKIQQMLDGTLSAKEDTALKAYFKQQGLPQEEVEQAIVAFKQQKAAQQPDVGALQQQAALAQADAQKAAVENKAILSAIELGIDAKTVPYLLRLADLSTVTGADGTINEEALKTALNKVLEDVPALNPKVEQPAGYKQIGAGGSSQQPNTGDALKAAFGL